jgi:hypothetical protein
MAYPGQSASVCDLVVTRGTLLVMTTPDLEEQIRALRKAILHTARVVDSLAAQWSTTAYETGEPEPGIDEEPDPTPELPTPNEIALGRRNDMQAVKESLGKVPE